MTDPNQQSPADELSYGAALLVLAERVTYRSEEEQRKVIAAITERHNEFDDVEVSDELAERLEHQRTAAAEKRNAEERRQAEERAAAERAQHPDQDQDPDQDPDREPAKPEPAKKAAAHSTRK